jgi:hypothetical protein
MANSSSRVSSLPISTRVNSRLPSVPTTGNAESSPMAMRCSRVRLAALTVMIPARLPAGSELWIRGTRIRLEVATGTATAAASSL